MQKKSVVVGVPKQTRLSYAHCDVCFWVPDASTFVVVLACRPIFFVLCRYFFFRLEAASYCNCTGYCTTYHRVVAHAHEAHHLNVCWN